VIKTIASKAKLKLWSWRQSRPQRVLLLPLFPLVAIAGWLAKSRSRVTDARNSNIFILHFGAIGDALMATPAIRLLHQQYPSAEIDVLTASRSALDIFSRNPRIKRASFLQQYDAGNIKERFHEKRSLWRDRLLLFFLYPTLVIRLLADSYHIGIALGPLHEGATFSNILFDLVGIPLRVGALGAHPEVLTHAADPKIAKLHWVDFYREIIKTLIAEPCDIDDSLDYAVSETERARAGEFLRTHRIQYDQAIAVIHPGGNLFINSKRWAPEKFAEVADSLDNRFSSVVITGSADEKEVAEQVKQAMRMRGVNAAGELTFGETAAVLKRAALLITNDTGILHLADAVGVPQIISIFGPTDPKKIAPRNNRNRIVSANLECAPCIDFDAGDPSKRCWRTIKEECLGTITVKQVLGAIEPDLPVTRELEYDSSLALVAGHR